MEKNPDLVIRKGEKRDIPFIIDTIVAAEKSGTEKFSYATILEMPEMEVRKIFADILAEDAQGQELCYSGYLVAEVNGKHAGSVAAWIEGESGQRSTMIKALLLNFFFPKRNVKKAEEKKKYLDAMHFDPELNALVIDIGFTFPQFRGQGLLAKLMNEQMRIQLERRPDVKTSHIHVMKNNPIAFNIYSKLGYYTIREKKCDDPIVLEWLPSDTQIIMEKKF